MGKYAILGTWLNMIDVAFVRIFAAWMTLILVLLVAVNVIIMRIIES
ncbi:MAG: hypothetical protein GY862_15420 [Gammaproteobacteria bacterium]|nr:hypothetical protein [Gammaproteobacteria bacterium]